MGLNIWLVKSNFGCYFGDLLKNVNLTLLDVFLFEVIWKIVNRISL